MISVFHLLKSGICAEPIWSGYLGYPENMSKKAVDLPVCRLALTYAHVLKTEEMGLLPEAQSKSYKLADGDGSGSCYGNHPAQLLRGTFPSIHDVDIQTQTCSDK